MSGATALGLRVLWVAYSDTPGLHADPARLQDHWSAGRRLRVGIPAAWLAQAGVSQWLVSPPSADGLREALALKPDVAVVSGLYPNVDERRNARSYFDCVDALRDAGVTVVVDLAENHFQDARAAEYREMIERSDGLVVNTQALADVIAEQTGRDCVVIGDPVEGVRCAPAFDPPARQGVFARLAGRRQQSRPLRLLWFGGQERNYEYLRTLVPELARFARSMPLEVSVVTGANPEITADIARWRNAGAGLDARTSIWSPAVLARELAGCDMVIIPSEVMARMAASTNRIAESIWAGRFVVANGLPSYWVFREAAWIGDSIIQGLHWALDHSNEAAARIATGQALIAGHYSPEAIGRLWQQTLAHFAGHPG
jgi:hypothetical protein